MNSLVYAPGQRHAVVHIPRGARYSCIPPTPRPGDPVVRIGDEGTYCDLPVDDGWQCLPPELSTPICPACLDARAKARAEAAANVRAVGAVGPGRLPTAAPPPRAPAPAAPVTAEPMPSDRAHQERISRGLTAWLVSAARRRRS